MTIQENVNGKNILIWGYGREGKSTEKYLKEYCNCKSIEIFEGALDEIDEAKYDLIIKSPGIVMDEDRPKYSSATELFLMQYRDQVIGITGTKGKSTTSSMMAHVLSDCQDRPVVLLGNIGLPCMDYCPQITKDTIIVFELSCHQLKHTKVSPHVAVFLNLFEEHLDYYKTMEAYFKAKSHVASYQEESDYFFRGENVPIIDVKSQVITIKQEAYDDNKLLVFGSHNKLNAQFVRTIARNIFDCNDEEISRSLSTFKGLEHRLQSVGEFEGINFYDDSISTIPEAAISALESIPNVKTILIGGMDRGISYKILEDYILKHDEFYYIFMYDTGKRIADEIMEMQSSAKHSDEKISDGLYVVKDLREAVSKAFEITPKGKGCVMSPAAASYGFFKNFEERGEIFVSFLKQH